MQAKLHVRDAQEHFKDLHLSSVHHDDDYSSTSADSALQHKLASASNCIGTCCEVFDEGKEIAKLASFFGNQVNQQVNQASVDEHLSANALAVVLPPPVKYNRASRKAAAMPQHERPIKRLRTLFTPKHSACHRANVADVHQHRSKDILPFPTRQSLGRFEPPHAVFSSNTSILLNLASSLRGSPYESPMSCINPM